MWFFFWVLARISKGEPTLLSAATFTSQDPQRRSLLPPVCEAGGLRRGLHVTCNEQSQAPEGETEAGLATQWPWHREQGQAGCPGLAVFQQPLSPPCLTCIRNWGESRAGLTPLILQRRKREAKRCAKTSLRSQSEQGRAGPLLSSSEEWAQTCLHPIKHQCLKSRLCCCVTPL